MERSRKWFEPQNKQLIETNMTVSFKNARILYNEFRANLSATVRQCITAQPEFLNFKEPNNRFQGTDSARLCRLAARYDKPIPTRFLAPIDCLKIPALVTASPSNFMWGGFCSADFFLDNFRNIGKLFHFISARKKALNITLITVYTNLQNCTRQHFLMTQILIEKNA